jgi:hypothetical protein
MIDAFELAERLRHVRWANLFMAEIFFVCIAFREQRGFKRHYRVNVVG